MTQPTHATGLSPHYREILDQADRFARKELHPLLQKMDDEEWWPEHLFPLLGENGYLGVTVPEALGGAGMDFFAQGLVGQAFSRWNAGAALSIAAHDNLCLNNVLRNASPALQKRYVPGLCKGTLVGALALTEPGAGSDALGSMTTEQFQQIVRDWLAVAKNPVTKRSVTEMVYQPMLELLAYLRANGFKTFIVSGGGIEFMRPWTEKIYGVPPEQVVGSSIKVRYELRDGKPVLMRLPEINFIDDKGGKPVGINQHIGRRPMAAFGNSDGDWQMLEYTKAAGGVVRLAMLVLHDDAKREFAYGPATGLPDSRIGTFSQALYDEAKKQGWVVISMKNDWKRIFAFE